MMTFSEHINVEFCNQFSTLYKQNTIYLFLEKTIIIKLRFRDLKDVLQWYVSQFKLFKQSYLFKYFICNMVYLFIYLLFKNGLFI